LKIQNKNFIFTLKALLDPKSVSIALSDFSPLPLFNKMFGFVVIMRTAAQTGGLVLD
jgi:hypothetical protein